MLYQPKHTFDPKETDCTWKVELNFKQYPKWGQADEYYIYYLYVHNNSMNMNYNKSDIHQPRLLKYLLTLKISAHIRKQKRKLNAILTHEYQPYMFSKYYTSTKLQFLLWLTYKAIK